jgi:hypothetical protein
MKLDNVGQIITSEIQVKAWEDVPRGTEGRRVGERRSGRASEQESEGVGELESGRIAYFLCLSLPRSPTPSLTVFHVERMMFITYL